MKFDEKYDVNKDFLSLFEFDSEKEELKHDANILMFKFLSEVERATENTIKNKDLALALASSRSFISQLFKGNKLANLMTLAKIQKSYDLTFEVKAILNQHVNMALDMPNVESVYEPPKKQTNVIYDKKLTFMLGEKDRVSMQKAS